LAEFAQQNVFDVLGMKDTSYGPIVEKKKLNRVAPTEKQPDGTILLGSVHDPLARVLNHGNSGNAGVFSTAEDLAILYAALLNGGEINGHRIMGRLTVDKMFSVPENVKHLGRTLGWDSYSSYAGNKGDLFSSKAVCHTGYTGTSVVLDPENDVAMILLTNAVHPSDSGRTGRLRSAVANLVAGAIMD
jgi:CubicO group peptidase (beta-lactamase class C family)